MVFKSKLNKLAKKNMDVIPDYDFFFYKSKFMKWNQFLAAPGSLKKIENYHISLWAKRASVHQKKKKKMVCSPHLQQS